MKTILIVEDEVTISRILSAYLKKADYDVVQAFDGDEALQVFKQVRPALVLLDIMLPGKDGWEILTEIRRMSACPVIMLTALGEVDQRLSGLNQGADDYITKPFVADEVIARVNAVLRRSSQVLESGDVKYFGSLTVDVKAYLVSLNGELLDLTPRDLSLLLFFAHYPNQIFTRDQLIDKVWGIDFDGSDRAVDLSIKRLRKALEKWPDSEGEIKTIRGLGYQFCVYEKK